MYYNKSELMKKKQYANHMSGKHFIYYLLKSNLMLNKIIDNHIINTNAKPMQHNIMYFSVLLPTIIQHGCSICIIGTIL